MLMQDYYKYLALFPMRARFGHSSSARHHRRERSADVRSLLKCLGLPYQFRCNRIGAWRHARSRPRLQCVPGPYLVAMLAAGFRCFLL